MPNARRFSAGNGHKLHELWVAHKDRDVRRLILEVHRAHRRRFLGKEGRECVEAVGMPKSPGVDLTRPIERSDLMHAPVRRTPFSDPGWLFEWKYDGFRCVVRKTGDRFDLLSRNGNSLWFFRMSSRP